MKTLEKINTDLICEKNTLIDGSFRIGVNHYADYTIQRQTGGKQYDIYNIYRIIISEYVGLYGDIPRETRIVDVVSWDKVFEYMMGNYRSSVEDLSEQYVKFLNNAVLNKE